MLSRKALLVGCGGLVAATALPGCGGGTAPKEAVAVAANSSVFAKAGVEYYIVGDQQYSASGVSPAKRTIQQMLEYGGYDNTSQNASLLAIETTSVGVFDDGSPGDANGGDLPIIGIVSSYPSTMPTTGQFSWGVNLSGYPPYVLGVAPGGVAPYFTAKAQCIISTAQQLALAAAGLAAAVVSGGAAQFGAAAVSASGAFLAATSAETTPLAAAYFVMGLAGIVGPLAFLGLLSAGITTIGLLYAATACLFT